MYQDDAIWILSTLLAIAIFIIVLLAIEGMRVRAVAKLLAQYVQHIAIESGSACAWELVGRVKEIRVLDDKDCHPSTSAKDWLT